MPSNASNMIMAIVKSCSITRSPRECRTTTARECAYPAWGLLFIGGGDDTTGYEPYAKATKLYIGTPRRVMCKVESKLLGTILLEHQGFDSGILAVRAPGAEQDMIKMSPTVITSNLDPESTAAALTAIACSFSDCDLFADVRGDQVEYIFRTAQQATGTLMPLSMEAIMRCVPSEHAARLADAVEARRRDHPLWHFHKVCTVTLNRENYLVDFKDPRFCTVVVPRIGSPNGETAVSNVR